MFVSIMVYVNVPILHIGFVCVRLPCVVGNIHITIGIFLLCFHWFLWILYLPIILVLFLFLFVFIINFIFIDLIVFFVVVTVWLDDHANRDPVEPAVNLGSVEVELVGIVVVHVEQIKVEQTLVQAVFAFQTLIGTQVNGVNRVNRVEIVRRRLFGIGKSIVVCVV